MSKLPRRVAIVDGAWITVPLALEPADRAKLAQLLASPPPAPADAPRGLDGRIATVRETHRN